MTKVIAEIGSNWQTLHDCLESVKLAKIAGADVVKFQLFDSIDLFGPNAEDRTVVNEHALSKKWLTALADHARLQKIEFMCTAFSPEGYAFIDPLVMWHKIASSEMNHPEILEAVNGFKKPVCLSIAGAGYDEIDFALTLLKDCPIILMYCVGDYPARVIDFRHFSELRAAYGPRCKIGYSDHSLDVYQMASQLPDFELAVVEKHVNFTDLTTPDSPHSLNADEFKIYCKAVKGLEVDISETESLCNINMRKEYRRVVVAKEFITMGDPLKNKVGFYRQTNIHHSPLKPKAMWGRDFKARRHILKGDVIGVDDIQ